MIKTVFRWAILFALCNASQSFFNINPYVVNAIMKRNYSQNFLTLRGMSRCDASNASNASNGSDGSDGSNGSDGSKGSDASNGSDKIQNVPILRPKPIPVISFDVLFLNWNNVNRIFLSSDSDRIILFYGNDKKGVYYIHADQLNKIEFLLSKTPAVITIEAVCNLDNKWFHLYCSPRSGRGDVIKKTKIKKRK